jgi:hypothetical protein
MPGLNIYKLSDENCPVAIGSNDSILCSLRLNCVPQLPEQCIRLIDREVALWKTEYNEERSHSSLGYGTPAAFARVAITPNYGKDVGCAYLENASGVCHLPAAPAMG